MGKLTLGYKERVGCTTIVPTCESGVSEKDALEILAGAMKRVRYMMGAYPLTWGSLRNSMFLKIREIEIKDFKLKPGEAQRVKNERRLARLIEERVIQAAALAAPG